VKDLYIVGAGGFGREVYSWLQDEAKLLQDYNFRGFLDDNAGALDDFGLDAKVVAPISGFKSFDNSVFICGIGAVAHKKRLCEPMILNGAVFLTLVHPSVVMGRNVKLGTGVVLCPRVTLTCDIELGAMVMINCHSSAGHDVKIGAWSTVSAHCDLTGGTEVGVGAFLGSGCRLLPTKKVGDGGTVGAGAVVIRNVPDCARVFGNPAREF